MDAERFLNDQEVRKHRGEWTDPDAGREPLGSFFGCWRADAVAVGEARGTARRRAGLPTHGAGSFCASGTPQEERTSTIARERAENPALAGLDLESFVEQQLAGLAAFPAYYAHMAPINRAGPKVYGSVPEPPALGAESFAARVGTAHVVDARDGREFAASHILGSLNVQLQDSFASYVGWLVPFNTPVLLVLPEPESDAVREAGSALFRIGFERVAGYLEGGINAWRSAGREVRSYPVGARRQGL